MKRRTGVWLLAALGVGTGGWYLWSGTVYYSLYQIQRAVKTHDRYLFEKHVDVQTLSRRTIDAFFNTTIDAVSHQDQEMAETIGVGIGRAIGEMWKPRLTEELGQAILRAVETGSLKQGTVEARRGDEASSREAP